MKIVFNFFHNSRNCVASGSYDGQLKIWSAKVETIPDQNGVIEEGIFNKVIFIPFSNVALEKRVSIFKAIKSILVFKSV